MAMEIETSLDSSMEEVGVVLPEQELLQSQQTMVLQYSATFWMFSPVVFFGMVFWWVGEGKVLFIEILFSWLATWVDKIYIIV